MDDAELLEQYPNGQSEEAFRALVERHLPLVYSAALRQAGDARLAEDLTHVVFILLERKSAQIPAETILADWLFETTRQIIAKALTGKYHRRRREQKAPGSQRFGPTYTLAQVSLFLDAALARLDDSGRQAVLLHYFQFKRPAEIGVALGFSEDTAQWKIDRATRKLHKILQARGVNLPMEILPGLLMTRGALAPPSHLGESVTAAA